MPGQDAAGSPMAGKSSTTTFIVGDQLPWPDDSFPSLSSKLLDAGAIYHSTTRRDCFIRKVSALGATVRGELASAPGDIVAVELGTGQRPAGTIAWVAGGEAGVSFHQPVDVLALINRSLVSQPAERRRMPRVELRCAVHLRCGGDLRRATMR